MKLFSFRFPNKMICNNEELYFHRTPDSQVFDTYFNCFPISQYIQYTNLYSVTLSFILNESALAYFYLKTEDKLILLSTKNIEKNIKNTFNYNIDNKLINSILFVKFTAPGLHKKSCILKQADWSGEVNIDSEKAPVNINLACVICTYKREEFVLKNLQSLMTLKNNTNLNFEVFIIDNGNTLKSNLNLPHTNYIHIINNKNLGGSGGFTRGIMEVLNSNLNGTLFTHLLLMDDDIVFDPEVIFKTITFLQLIKSDYTNTFLAGSMLKLDKPTIQHEAAGYYNSLFIKSLNSNLDLGKSEAIIKNLKPHKADYAAWWYCVIPLESINKNNLPLPFFIKSDDIEYSLRVSRQIITLNGICVWHKSFASKDAPYLMYYIIRNRLITNALHKKNTYFTNILLIIARYLRAIQKNLQAIPFIKKAFLDFLKGPDFFLEIDGEQLNNELKEMQKQYEKKDNKVVLLFSALKNCPLLIIKFLLKPTISLNYKKSFPNLVSWESWCKRLNYYFQNDE